MLYTTRINNLVTFFPKLSRIWIKTSDSQTPLKAVWLDERKLHDVVNPDCSAVHDGEAELAEDHLCFAA
ncbi:MAG: hypothetical protein P4M04_02455 [Acidobacteriota bacterium]|nr:hypothetical protein [Acidobacteriota bacterium]